MRTLWEDEGRDWDHASPSQGTPEIRGEAQHRFSLGPQKEPTMLTPRSKTCSPQKCETINVFCLSDQFLVLWYSGTSKLIHTGLQQGILHPHAAYIAMAILHTMCVS